MIEVLPQIEAYSVTLTIPIHPSHKASMKPLHIFSEATGLHLMHTKNNLHLSPDPVEVRRCT